MVVFALSKRGYGSITELKNMEEEEFFQLVSYENMINEIESLIYEEANEN